MISIKKIKSIIRESNFASYGGVRGLGAVTGDAAGGATGPLVNWITQNNTQSQNNTDAHQSLVADNNNLHTEIEDNDLNPKDANKKVKTIIQK